MTDDGYKRYLKETGKSELIRRSVAISNPSGSLLALENELSETWTWGVLPHNCVSFCETIITAGGGTWGSYSNCPALATSDTLSVRLQTAYGWLSGNIYSIYGVPTQ